MNEFQFFPKFAKRSMAQEINIIYAISENGVIGKDNGIPWRLSNDLKRYKSLTINKPIIMGRKTFESIGRPLPKRRNIVITRNQAYQAEGIEVVHSLKEALDLCANDPQVWIVGGAGIYQEAIQQGIVDHIYETLVHAEVEGDTFMNEPDEAIWELFEIDAQQADEKNEFAYTYRTWRKK
jgi:dihydrofolate reductase